MRHGSPALLNYSHSWKKLALEYLLLTRGCQISMYSEKNSPSNNYHKLHAPPKPVQSQSLSIVIWGRKSISMPGLDNWITQKEKDSFSRIIVQKLRSKKISLTKSALDPCGSSLDHVSFYPFKEAHESNMKTRHKCMCMVSFRQFYQITVSNLI